MHEENIIIKTKNGNLDSRIFITDKQNNPFIIFYMDAPAIREELRDMCRKIASKDYNVILPNLFYRVGTEGNYPFNQITYKNDKIEFKKMVSTMNATSNEMIAQDTKYILKYISETSLNTKKVGIVGYCMSGRFVVTCGGLYSENIVAIASFYGVDILTSNSDSPHLLAKKIKGELYLAFAEQDIWVSNKILKKIKKTFSETHNKVVIDIYSGTDHGFAFPSRSTYMKEAAEKHWEKLFDLFDRNLHV